MINKTLPMKCKNILLKKITNLKLEVIWINQNLIKKSEHKIEYSTINHQSIKQTNPKNEKDNIRNTQRVKDKDYLDKIKKEIQLNKLIINKRALGLADILSKIIPLHLNHSLSLNQC